MAFGAVLGQVIINRRKHLKLSQGEAARAMRLPQSSLSRLERGAAMFTVAQLRRAAVALKTEAIELLRDADAGAAALSKRGVTVLDEEPPEEDRARWLWIAAGEVAQAVGDVSVGRDDTKNAHVKRRVEL